MIAANYGNVSDIEVAWTLIALIGLVYSILNLIESVGDLKFLNKENISNGRRSIARTAIASEALRAVIQTIFLIIGLLAMLIPDTPTNELSLKYLLISIFFRWGLIVSSVCLTVKTYLIRRVRHIVREDAA